MAFEEGQAVLTADGPGAVVSTKPGWVAVEVDGEVRNYRPKSLQKPPEEPEPLELTPDPKPRAFVFVGDQKSRAEDRDPCDPAEICMYGYTFIRAGDAVEVSDEVAERLAGNAHFSED